ncbi:hypothetical protein [Parapedobacter koreensis]|uniref:Uncharacterized protein n=1 Tax=Parapedobacter koreensis TaxID=332977 RepID=A0A1H7T201_9SPHI|nr:hypothetical protein [Parapedobacter koreensis]SEL78306.1 hypothetical protein SAMN05421740_11015 [Parapedobacter koreensis]
MKQAINERWVSLAIDIAKVGLQEAISRMINGYNRLYPFKNG